MEPKTTTASHNSFPFDIGDQISYEFAESFSFRGNLTGSYQEKDLNSSFLEKEYAVSLWTIEKIDAYYMTITNLTDHLISFEIRRHQMNDYFEEFKITKSSVVRIGRSFESYNINNITISLDNFTIIESTNKSIYPLDCTPYFINDNDLLLGNQVTIMNSTYQVANQSTISTYDGVKNVTNVVGNSKKYSIFLTSNYLNRYIYFGDFYNTTMLSYARDDGLFISGTIQCYRLCQGNYSTSIKAELLLSKSMDIISSSIMEHAKETGPIYLLIIGGVTELLFLYFFERKTIITFFSPNKSDPEKKEKLKIQREHINREEVYLPLKEK